MSVVATVRNVSPGPLSLTGGRVLTPGGEADVNETDPHEAALISVGDLEVIDPDAPAPLAPPEPRFVVVDETLAVDGDIVARDVGSPYGWSTIPTGSGPAIPSVEAFGASWVVGHGAPAVKYGAVQRLAKQMAATLSNASLSGGRVTGDSAVGGAGLLLQDAAFATDLLAGPYVTPGGLKLCFIGANDYAGWNALTQGNANVENALALAYSRLLAARVIEALKAGPALDTVAMTYGAGWTAFADATISSGLGYAYTTTAGSYVDVPLDANYGGEAVTVILPLAASATKFVAEVKVDSVAVATYDTAAFQTNLIATSQNGTACLRLPAGTITPGAHALRVTALSISGTYATFGGVIIEGAAPLLLPSAPPMPSDSAVKAQFAWSNARNQAAMAAFPSATWVDLTSAMSPNTGTASEADDLAYWNAATPGHPNTVGYGRIAGALLAAARRVPADKIAQMS